MIRLACSVVIATTFIGLRMEGSGESIDRSSLPLMLDSFLADEVHPAAAERAALLSGQPLTRLLDADPAQEIAVFGAVWVNAPSTLYVQQVKNIEEFEKGEAFRLTKRISDPPAAPDFSAFDPSDQDLSELKDCKMGDCAIKLGADALQTLRATVDWQKPTAKVDAAAALRHLALQYVRGYREGGNARLAVYRDKERPTFVANEFQSMIDRLPRLATDLPDLKRYLLDYPRATLAGSTDFLYWQTALFGLKPTMRISHLVIQQRPGETVVASKMLYATHYFWTALEFRALLADPARGRGFWFVTVNRSRADGLGGFTGRIIRARVRDEVQNGTRAALIAAKTKLELLATP